jgi:hypothetical protein
MNYKLQTTWEKVSDILEGTVSFIWVNIRTPNIQNTK